MTTPFVRIKLAGAAGSFVKLDIRSNDDVSDLATRACTQFPSWKAIPARISLFLVPADRARAVERDDSSSSDLLSGAPLFSGDLLADAGVVASSYILVLKYDDGAAAPAFAFTCISSALVTTMQHWLTVAFQPVGGSLPFLSRKSRERRCS